MGHLHDEHEESGKPAEAGCGGGCGCSGGEHNHEMSRGGLILLAVAGVMLVLGLALHGLLPGAGLWGSGAGGAYLVAIVSAGWLVVPHAWEALRAGRLDMNVLMTIAVAGAVGIGEWAEAAVVVFLFAFAEWLEGVSVRRAKRAVWRLMDLAPDTAVLMAGDELREVPAAEVKVGDRVLVRSGARLPLDGVVLAGESGVDQSPITGESIPVAKGPGDEVFAGSINGEGSLEVRVTRPAGETTLARMVRLVEEAQATRAPAQRFVDRFAQIYTPTVVGLAVLLAVVPPLMMGAEWGVWFYRALVLLVIACPCALVIATPVSIVSGLTALARRGVLVKGGAALEAIGKLKALAVDKTGTITQGKPEVVEVQPLGGRSEAEVLRVAAAIDAHSTHPLARAVVAAAERAGVAWSRGGNFRSTGGRGADADVEGHPCFVGNHLFTHEAGVCTPEVEARLAKIEERANSVVVVGHRPHRSADGEECAGEVMGILAIRDVLRPEVPEALGQLHRLGVAPVVMLSGDHQRTASAIAEEAGIDEAVGNLLPEQKIGRLRKLMERHGAVGMVGDGVNDAPALAAATVGIAMGQGAATALETADIALLSNDLRRVADAIGLGRQTLRIIQGSIAFALGIKLLFLLMAALGYASLWMAILADTGATLIVIAAALTLLRYQPIVMSQKFLS